MNPKSFPGEIACIGMVQPRLTTAWASLFLGYELALE